jgi:hypothetical protein
LNCFAAGLSVVLPVSDPRPQAAAAVNKMWKAVDNQRKRMFERELSSDIKWTYVVVDKHTNNTERASFGTVGPVMTG